MAILEIAACRSIKQKILAVIAMRAARLRRDDAIEATVVGPGKGLGFDQDVPLGAAGRKTPAGLPMRVRLNG